MNENLSAYLHFNLLGDLKVSKSELCDLMMAITCYEKELRKKGFKHTLAGYELLFDKVNDLYNYMEKQENEIIKAGTL